MISERIDNYLTLVAYFPCYVIFTETLIRLKRGAFQYAPDPMMPPYLLANDRCKIAMETRPRRYNESGVVSRSPEGSDCKRMRRGYGLPS